MLKEKIKSMQMFKCVKNTPYNIYQEWSILSEFKETLNLFLLQYNFVWSLSGSPCWRRLFDSSKTEEMASQEIAHAP